MIFVDRYTYKILRYVKRSHTPAWTDVLNQFKPRRWVNRTERLLRAALDDGLVCAVDCARPPECRVKLTPAGEVAIQEFIEMDTNWLFNEVRAWLTLAISVLAFIKSFFF